MITNRSCSIVVVTHNEGDRLAKTVAGLVTTGPPRAELIVVDDFSTDESVGALRSARRDIRIVRPERRLGPPSARNFGALLASGEIVVWADAHVDPPPGWFDAFASVLDGRNVGAVGPAVSVMGNESSVGYGMRWKSPKLDVEWLPRATQCPYAVPILGGCFLAMRREVFERTGGFDDGLILWGGGDVELSFRLWMLGLECHVIPGVRVPHLFRSTFPYAVEAVAVLHNLLRIALVHFNESRLAQVVEALRTNPVFSPALARVAASDVWSRRAQMRNTRRRDDDWFFERFDVPGFGTQVSEGVQERS
jgi:GT2 family glycosyltransferase